MDSFIYSLVLVPALTELLPRSGIPATPANVGYYGGIFFTLFLIESYGTGKLVWGPIADRFGRVRTMVFSILCFSLFTLLAAFAPGIWSPRCFASWPESELAASGRSVRRSFPRIGPRSGAPWARR